MTINGVKQNAGQPDPQKHRLHLFPVILAVAVFYTAAMFLNAGGIQRNIELQRYGEFRDFSLALFRPVAEAAGRLGLTKFRTAIEKIGEGLGNATIKR